MGKCIMERNSIDLTSAKVFGQSGCERLIAAVVYDYILMVEFSMSA